MSLKISNEKVYCFDPKYRRYMRMGTKIGDTFFKTVESKHFMRVVGGYGLQYDAFSDFEAKGITSIHVYERHTGNVWMAKIPDWKEHGHIADYGRGKQIFLSLKYMTRKNKEKLEAERNALEMLRAENIARAGGF